jgi:transcriptional regulator with XRE-family HTH domain
MSNPRTPGEADRLFGQIVRDARKRTRFTQQQVAARLGISQQQYRKYETGQSKLFLETWMRLCRSLAIDPAEANGRLEKALAQSGEEQLAGFVEEGTAPYDAKTELPSADPGGEAVLRLLDRQEKLADEQRKITKELKRLLARR